MDTKNFLTRVFAQRDSLVICTHKPDPTGKNARGIFWNRGSYTDLDAAVADIAQWDKEPNTTIYFGVGAFANHGYTDSAGKAKWHRKQEMSTWFKALALDLDIGADKPYATQKEGWLALSAALKAIGMPMPMVVSSGRGIHCYWPFTEPVSAAHWIKASTALRVALEEQNVVIDTSKIHDPSMVLRPVGTHNKKQTPWKVVECKADCPDYDALSLFTVLRPWVGKGVSAKPAARTGKGLSSVAAAVLNSNDVDVGLVAENCKQVAALVMSGGVTDAAGQPVTEPLWRASLGLAKHATDVPQAVIMLAGQHPDFNLDDSLAKMNGWRGTGPTTCAKFEQLCGKGCEGCRFKGSITSPAQLSISATSTVVTDDGVQLEIKLPDGYIEKDNKVWKEVKKEITTKDANGVETASVVTEWELVSPYLMHITGVYKDKASTKSTFRLAVKYPMTGWQEEDHDIGCIASVGKEFSTFMLHRQVFSVKGVGQQEKLRGYLMDYLTMVQSMAPTGQDYVTFGWQDDGSFLCGESLFGSPSGAIDRRLRGPAARFAELVKPHGSKDLWISAMQMLNDPGAQTIRAAVLIATSGVLGKVAGNASMVMSIYSNETTTGKSLALIAANSLIGMPKELFLNKEDTSNALYKIRGVLNNLPCCIDELTSAQDSDIANMAYQLSQGREKIAMTKDRELREPAKWEGPTLITTNVSLHQKFEAVQSSNDPLKARCLELHHHDRTFISADAGGRSKGYVFFDLVAKNNGWAFPELVEAVIAMGGPEVVWEKGEAAFNKRFGFTFEPQERFYRTGLISSWVMGQIGARLGLFPFDVDATTQFLLDRVLAFRQEQAAAKQDVFDTIGQFLQEHHDQIVEVTENYGSNKEVVHTANIQRGVARLKVVHDANNPVLPGSVLAINLAVLRTWLGKTRDGLDRVTRELADNGALVAARDRVTIFKGCTNRNPGQAHCLIVNMNHPRFISSLTGNAARMQSSVALAVINGGKP